MRVLLAGASGAVGTPLTRLLVDGGHEVLGLTRSAAGADRLRALGARPVVADVLDRPGLLTALMGERADAVIHEMTALKKVPLRHAGMRPTNELRTTGTANLLAAARVVHAHRFVTQSIVFGYGFNDHGGRVLTEDDPFGIAVPGPVGEHVAAMRATEDQVFTADEIDGVALRYGLFYGPGAGDREMVRMLRKRRFAVPAGGGGAATFSYIEDAVAATVAALEKGRPGQAYNIVDDEPVRWGEFADAVAVRFGAPRPPRMPRWLLRVLAPYGYQVLTTSMRVSNGKAKRELGWVPRHPTYRDGIEAMAAAVGGRR